MSPDRFLILNAGSSSLKFALFSAGADPQALHRGQVEGLGGRARLQIRAAGIDRELEGVADITDALGVVLAWIGQLPQTPHVVAIGHRVVHGGVNFSHPVRIDASVLAGLHALTPLAPLHQPHNLAGIAAARAHFPDAPQVACFDTAFHHGHAFEHDAFALPREFHEAGVRRYGFHGLSYEYVAQRLRAVAPDLAARRVVIAHLGNGASMCALREGRSVTSTMGFTALDGLPMGTRPGQIDPGVLLWMMSERGMDAAGIGDLLYRRSGLLGLSGLSNDMRVLHASDTPAARQAIDYFVMQLRRAIASLAAAIGGLDALVFTAGIGENDALLRARVLGDLQWMGVRLDDEANRTHGRPAADGCISATDSAVRVMVLPTDEEQMIARHVAACLGPDGG